MNVCKFKYEVIMFLASYRMFVKCINREACRVFGHVLRTGYWY